VTEDRSTIAFAEKVLALLELGSFSATYKYALLTALMDLCLEHTSDKGVAPSVLTTRQLAKKVVQLYWVHTTPYEGGAVLRQGGAAGDQQAEIVRAVESFRAERAGAAGELYFKAELEEPKRFERLVRTVEWKLIEMPIPRLQVMGREEDRFLYEYAWTQAIRQGEVSRYQRGEGGGFDNRLLLQPRVAERLIALTGVLRPVIRREWALKIASMNALPEARLEEFLFGVERTALETVRAPLRELQRGRCFYCSKALDRRTEVDHFIPWARYADNALDNLVLAHDGCNNQKRDFFAATEHLERWLERSSAEDDQLDAIATSAAWPRSADRSRLVAKALYRRLPDGARVWRRANELVPLDRSELERLF